MRCASLLLTALSSTVLACPASAHPRGPSAPYSMILEDAYGRELRTFHHAGKTFIQGEYGARYNIRIRNRTGRRVEAVVSVDGRDAISGHVGDYVGERGYIIDAYDEIVIEGFRQSLDRVAAFRFTSPDDSYSSRMGTPENVGVVGVALFPERERVALPYRPWRRHRPHAGRAEDAAPSRAAPKASAPAAESEGPATPASRGRTERAARARRDRSFAPRDSVNNLGTQYGESRDSHASEVPFERANSRHPEKIIVLRYDDRKGLAARGIRVDARRAVAQRPPYAFPNNRFAPPPPGY